jgi:prepilin-type N-terminal cleavage/methylation domain-containing protein
MLALQAFLANPKTKKVLSRRPGSEGFSLIELVVVVAVLAILAAIAIPAFTSINGKARASAASNTLATLAKECAAKIADQGVGNATAVSPKLDGYSGAGNGFYIGGVRIAPGGTITCSDTALYEMRSDDPTEYPTWRYDAGTAAKTCSATGPASLARGCNGNPGTW